jgi:hypothetical protein
MPAVRELQITRMNTQAAVAAAAALDDVTGADREPAGQTNSMGTHDTTSGQSPSHAD